MNCNQMEATTNTRDISPGVTNLKYVCCKNIFEEVCITNLADMKA